MLSLHYRFIFVCYIYTHTHTHNLICFIIFLNPADQLLKGADFQPRPTNAIEGQRATPSDVESDHAHDD